VTSGTNTGRGLQCENSSNLEKLLSFFFLCVWGAPQTLLLLIPVFLLSACVVSAVLQVEPLFLLHLIKNLDKSVPLNRQEKGQEDRVDLTFIFDSRSSEFIVAFPVVEHLHRDENLSLLHFYLTNVTKVS